MKTEPLILSPNESESNIRDEANKRTCRAGYTDGDGQQKVSRNLKAAGKGDVPRPVNKKQYDENYKRIFGHD